MTRVFPHDISCSFPLTPSLGPPSYLLPGEAEYDDYYNRQAREYRFRVNNTNCAEDEIDLHGLHVIEATDMLRERIEVDIKMGRSGIHV